jgi:hypothetical protein
MKCESTFVFITTFVYILVCYEVKIFVSKSICSVMTARCESNYTTVKRRKRLFAVLTSFLRRIYLSNFALYSSQLRYREGQAECSDANFILTCSQRRGSAQLTPPNIILRVKLVNDEVVGEFGTFLL